MSERPTGQPNEDDLEPDAGDVAIDSDAEDEEFGSDEPTIEEGDAALLAAAEEAPLASIAAMGGVEEAGQQARPMRPSERRALRAAMDHTQLTVDPAHRVSDRASAAFVLVTVAAFVLILFNGLLLGHGGLLTPVATPSPVPSLTASPAPSGSAAASPTVAPSTTPAVTPTPGVTAPPPSVTPGPS